MTEKMEKRNFKKNFKKMSQNLKDKKRPITADLKKKKKKDSNQGLASKN